jgi:hypothetical protein
MDVLNPGQELWLNGVMTPPNGRGRLIMQGDGNLVFYRARGENPYLWDTATNGTGATRLAMQEDGNLVIYTPTHPVWASNTAGNPGAHFRVQDDGNLVIYARDGRAIWASASSFWPLRATTSWRQSAMSMDANVVLTSSGQLRADIRTWCTWVARGFTGGCEVLIADANQTVIHNWLVWPLGVDGTGIFWKRSDRRDYPMTQIPADVVARADYILVACSHMPKDRFTDILNEFRAKAEQVKAFIETWV